MPKKPTGPRAPANPRKPSKSRTSVKPSTTSKRAVRQEPLTLMDVAQALLTWRKTVEVRLRRLEAVASAMQFSLPYATLDILPTLEQAADAATNRPDLPPCHPALFQAVLDEVRDATFILKAEGPPVQ